MIYVKLENERLIKYRQPIHTEYQDIFTNNPDILKQYGYYPLHSTNPPECDETHFVECHWEQLENEIIQVWEVFPIEDNQ